MKINFKKFFLILLFTFIIGALFVPFVDMNIYDDVIMPAFAPPKIIFPIVWGILYLLMSISYYIVSERSNNNCNTNIYVLQLIVNSFWTLIFFGFRWFLIGWLWIILLFILVIVMIVRFYRVKKIAGLLQIPYLIWLAVAFYLNFSIYLLN